MWKKVSLFLNSSQPGILNPWYDLIKRNETVTYRKREAGIKATAWERAERESKWTLLLASITPPGPVLLRTTLQSLGAAKPPDGKGTWLVCPESHALGQQLIQGWVSQPRREGWFPGASDEVSSQNNFYSANSILSSGEETALEKSTLYFFNALWLLWISITYFFWACFVVVVSLDGMKTQIAWSLFFFLSG